VDADIIIERRQELRQLRRRREPRPGDAARIEQLEGELLALEKLQQLHRLENQRNPEPGDAAKIEELKRELPSLKKRIEEAHQKSGSKSPDSKAPSTRAKPATLRTKPPAARGGVAPPSAPIGAQKVSARRQTAKVGAESAIPKIIQPASRDIASAPAKDNTPRPADTSSSRGDRITEALGDPDTLLDAVLDYQQYKAEGRTEEEALSRSAITLAANLKGGPAANIVNPSDPAQQLPAAKQAIKDKWNKLWS
jgi:hypothetical protein